MTREALTLAAHDAGVNITPAQSDAIAQNWASLPVFDDTRPALRALREAGWKLAVLTNCDDDLFALTQERIGIPFDAVITAQQVRSYKPALAHFQRFAQNIQDHDVWVHAARSRFHDIAPARESASRASGSIASAPVRILRRPRPCCGICAGCRRLSERVTLR